MSNRKFFSGLPDEMMNRSVVNRQATNFFWPNDSETELNSYKTAARNRMSSRCTSSASLSQSSADADESRRRNRLQQNDSKIDFYDYPDATDTESVISSRDRNRRKKNETLSSKIQFFDFVDGSANDGDDDVQSVIEMRSESQKKKDTVKSENNALVNEPNFEMSGGGGGAAADIENITKDIENMEIKSSGKKASYQYVDSYSEESDDHSQYYQRDKSGSSRMFDERRHLPPRYPSAQRFMQRRPRAREYYDYDDEFDQSYPYESSRRRSIQPPPNWMTRRHRGDHYSQEMSDEEYYFQQPPRHHQQPSYGLRSFYDEPQNSSRMSLNRRASVNGLADFAKKRAEEPPKPKMIAKAEVDHAPATERRTPVKTLKRTDSVNEAKQRYFTNLKSNIFHNNAEYSEKLEQKKPLSVRDFAASQRVGVGLPDIEFC